MIYTVKEMSLFDININLEEPYALAHCISSDFGMGAGIVVMFNKLYDMKAVLKRKYVTMADKWNGEGYVLPEQVTGSRGDCTKTVYNMITKRFVYDKPTYYTLQKALESLRSHMMEAGEAKLAMPLIGCGLDGLSWKKVEPMIQDVFRETPIEVVVCYLPKDKHLLMK